MKYLGLIWKSVWRKKIRTSLTVLSVLVAFLLYAVLAAINIAFQSGGFSSDEQRLITIEKISLINPLPSAHRNRIAQVEGVKDVVYATWFGSYYQEQRNLLSQFPVDPEEYWAMYPEFEMPPEQYDAWLKNRTGMVVGKEYADRFGWKVGDRVPVFSTIWTQSDGSNAWEFDVEGIFTNSEPGSSTQIILFHFDYFDEARTFGQGTVGWYIVRTEDGADPVQVGRDIDLLFANSPYQTKTSTETEFGQSFAKQFGNIALIVSLILGAVFFTLLLVSGNTMSQSVRERIPELAVMKTLGFGDLTVLGVVLAESILVMLIGGVIGVAIGWVLVKFLIAPMVASFIPGVTLTAGAIATGILIMVVAGIAAGLFPALKAMRITIIDALARG